MASQDTQRRCGNPVCGRVIEAKPTGRPADYCSPNCRQAVHRAKVRTAEATREHAERLATAQATVRRLFPLAEETYHEVSELAGEVFGTMADPGRDPEALGKALAAFEWAAQRLVRTALDYQDADNQAQALALVKPQAG